MNAEIISIGDELLIGQVINTNASWIAQELNKIGIGVNQISVISDERECIVRALIEASKRTGIIILTGGLGPTKDDLTKQTLCSYFKSKLVLDETVLGDIEKLFQTRGYMMTDLNRMQAEVPDSCKVIRNFIGTAPGMWFDYDDIIYISLPGVPFEMKAMMETSVIPDLQKMFSKEVIIHQTIMTTGVGESFLADKISDWENNLPEYIKLAYLPSPGVVRLRLSAYGKDRELLENKVKEETKVLSSLISEYIFSFNNETIEQVIARLLKEKNKTLSIAESCTGGYISHLITSISGSSFYYMGGLIAYSNEIKTQSLNVSTETIKTHGAVSEEAVKQMAVGIMNKFKTDFSVATSGICGPEGGSPDKPVGTVWIAVSSKTGVEAKHFMFGDKRDRNIVRASIAALNMLRKEIEK